MTHYTNCLLLVISFQKPTDVEEQFMLQILLGREKFYFKETTKNMSLFVFVIKSNVCCVVFLFK